MWKAVIQFTSIIRCQGVAIKLQATYWEKTQVP